MKRIFISQPISGKNELQIQMDREAAEEFLSGLFGAEAEVLNPLSDLVEFVAPTKSPLVRLADDIRDLSAADLVYFCAGWKKDRACKIAHEAATKYGLCVMYQPG